MSRSSSSSSAFLRCPESPVASWDSDEWDPLPAGVCPVSLLLSAEAELFPLPVPGGNAPSEAAVNWILNVTEFYRFSPPTAFLAVSYLHRFLATNSLPAPAGQGGETGGGWPMQLLAVACVSVAAKMAETDVPPLLDLQILDPRFVFEPKTIMRMELLLMSSLRWRMRSITPFDFLDHFADSIGLDPLAAAARAALVSRSADSVLSTCRVGDFWAYRPSEIAAAAIFRAAKIISDLSDAELLRRFSDWVNEGAVSACVQLMNDSLTDTCPLLDSGKPEPEPRTPQSPVGVIDAAACGSCESQKSSTAVDSGRADPAPAKRRRLDDSLCTDHAAAGGSKNPKKD